MLQPYRRHHASTSLSFSKMPVVLHIEINVTQINATMSGGRVTKMFVVIAIVLFM